MFFLLVFGAIASNNVTIGEQAGNMLRNSPAAIFRITAIMSAFGVIIVSAIMSTPILRDFEHGTNHMLFSYPLGKLQFLAGRFFGSFVFVVFVFLSIPMGIFVASIIAPAVGWIEPSKFDSFRLMAYLSPFLFIVIPNALLSGSIFFALSTLKRKMIYSYLGSVLLVVLYTWGATQLNKLDSKVLAALIDPFGLASFFIDTQYWTPAEINTLLVPLSSKLLINRVIWITVGVFLFVFTYYKFKFTTVFEKESGKTPVQPNEELTKVGDLPRVSVSYSKWLQLIQMFSQGWLEFKSTVKEVPFIGIVVAGVLLLLSNAVSIGEMYGTNTYPVTYNLLDFTTANFMLIVFIIITFYSGEIVWRERGYGINQIVDALPLPNWFFAGSKLWAMFLILILLQIVLLIVNILTQVFHGFFEFNLPLYFAELFTIQLPVYFGIAVFAMLIQTFSSNKFVGHVIVLLYYIVFYISFGIMGIDHYLYKFPQVPNAPYSDMNGFGHYLLAVRWYQLAWILLTVVLISVTMLFWNRGFQLTFINRLRVARDQFKGSFRVIMFASLLGFIAVSSYIIYNTTVLNKHLNSEDMEKMQVDYEKTYKKYQGIPQPKIKSANINVDIYPNEREVIANGTFMLRNETRSSIDSVHFLIAPDFRLAQFTMGDSSELVLNDSNQGYYIAKLNSPLGIGDSLSFNFKIEFIPKGFKNSNSFSQIVYNGTFINNGQFLPVIGYQSRNEMANRDKRKKYKLPERQRMAVRTDSVALMRTYLGNIGDWIDFETTISTIPSQIAIAPGYLVKEWQENGRRYFHYKMSRPILNFYSFLSAEYEVLSDKWNDVDLKVYYHKGHVYNINKMIEAMKASLDYFTVNFSPFQHKELRIIEFPRYATFAQSFPTTIPYSENIGFIANLKSEDDIDYVYYVTAHEIAHQWWAHQVIGGDVQGATLMSEALAQYSALMVMEKRYGKDQMRKFLKYELDRYLRGRRSEMLKELPLTLVENQSYIHYNKGSVVMYALQDYIGEEKVNSALAAYLADWAYLNPPFSTSTHFMKYIDNVTPDSLKYLITDMFETITIYDIKAKEASMEKLDNGKYKVTLTADVQKFRADSLGNETPLTLNDWIDVGVMTTKEVDGKKKQVELYMQKHKIDKSNPTFEIIVDEKPETAGVDPYNKLIDRHSDNNTVKVK
jgi:hypothetical protein